MRHSITMLARLAWYLFVAAVVGLAAAIAIGLVFIIFGPSEPRPLAIALVWGAELLVAGVVAVRTFHHLRLRKF